MNISSQRLRVYNSVLQNFFVVSMFRKYRNLELQWRIVINSTSGIMATYRVHVCWKDGYVKFEVLYFAYTKVAMMRF